MGKIVGSQIVRVHMTLDEMSFVLVNRYFDRHILIDILVQYITQLEPFNPNDLGGCRFMESLGLLVPKNKRLD